MTSVNIYEAKTTLSKLIARVEQGEEITISRHGRPVARLTPVRTREESRAPGALAGKIRIAADFDVISPADEDAWYGS